MNTEVHPHYFRWRANAWNRQGRICCHCGHDLPKRLLTAEHIVPLSLGGWDVEHNIAAAHEACNKARDISMGPEWFKWLPGEMRQAAMAEIDRCIAFYLGTQQFAKAAILSEFQP